jgi:hypothetical protein
MVVECCHAGRAGLAATVVTLLTAVLVVLDINDKAMRRWWDGHALTTDTVSGLFVLMITLLVVDQVVSLRQINDRARAVAAQAATVMTQATRASQAVSPATAKGAAPEHRDTAAGELRTYMMMLGWRAGADRRQGVASVPEQAQLVAAEMARWGVRARPRPGRRPTTGPPGGADLRSASARAASGVARSWAGPRRRIRLT